METKQTRTFLTAADGRLERDLQLDIDFFSGYTDDSIENADLEVAVKCTGILAIKPDFHKEELTYYLMVDEDEMRCETQSCLATDLFPKYKLRRLLDCGTLKTIIIEHSGYFSEADQEAAGELGVVLEQRFAAKASRQVLKVFFTIKARLCDLFYY